MVSFDKLILGDGPIYQQIVVYIKREISSGSIHHEDEMPSRRTLSALLGVNPNTIQKAYKILEDEGIIESHSGSKSFVVLNEAKRISIKNKLIETDAKNAVDVLKHMGISKSEAIELLDKLWEEEE